MRDDDDRVRGASGLARTPHVSPFLFRARPDDRPHFPRSFPPLRAQGRHQARLRSSHGPTLLYVSSERTGTSLSLPEGIEWAPFPPPPPASSLYVPSSRIPCPFSRPHCVCVITRTTVHRPRGSAHGQTAADRGAMSTGSRASPSARSHATSTFRRRSRSPTARPCKAGCHQRTQTGPSL